jgi:hypothetical protein
MTDLSNLIERVEKASGPDREISRDILCLCGWSYEKRGRDIKLWMYGPNGERRDHPGVGLFDAPHVTKSTDAITALIEQKLPGLVVKATKLGDGSGHWQITEAWLSDTGDEVISDFAPMEPKPGALALCLAFLLALQSQEQFPTHLPRNSRATSSGDNHERD